MPWWHNLVLRKPGNQAKGNQDSLFPKGFPGSNPGHGVVYSTSFLTIETAVTAFLASCSPKGSQKA